MEHNYEHDKECTDHSRDYQKGRPYEIEDKLSKNKHQAPQQTVEAQQTVEEKLG